MRLPRGPNVLEELPGPLACRTYYKDFIAFLIEISNFATYVTSRHIKEQAKAGANEKFAIFTTGTFWLFLPMSWYVRNVINYPTTN